MSYLYEVNARNIDQAFIPVTPGASQKRPKTKTNLWELDKQLKDLDLTTVSKSDAVNRISENHDEARKVLEPVVKLCSRLLALGILTVDSEKLRKVNDSEIMEKRL